MDPTILEEFKATIQRLTKDIKHVQQYKEYQIEIIQDQHILQNIIDNKHCTAPLLLVSKYVHPKTPKSANHINDSVEDSEGSPLQLQQFQYDTGMKTTLSGTVMYPVSESSARYLLSVYNLCVESLSSAPLPMWVICDGDSEDSTVCLGCEIEMAEKDGYLLREYKVTMKGPIQNKNQLPKAPALLRAHGRTGTKSTAIHCSAEYDICGTPSSHEKMGSEDQISLLLKFKWDKLQSPLQTPPVEAKALLILGLVVGDMRSAAFNMYMELNLLQGFAKGIHEGIAEWAQGASDVPLINSVRLLMDEILQGDALPRAQEEDDENAHTDILTIRKDLDFTEQLWNILKDVSCFSELTECLQCVLGALQSGHLQPRVHRTNQCRLAQLVRDSYFNKMVMPSLRGTEPIEILAEIGIDKLSRDYVNTLVGKELVSENHLMYYMQADVGLSERLMRLEKLFYSLEAAVLLQQFLQLPRQSLSIAVRHTLKYFESHNVDERHTFTIPIQASSVVGQLEKDQPFMWKAEIVSPARGGEEQTVCLLTTTPTFSHLNVEEEKQHDVTESTEETDRQCSYYITMVSQTLLDMST